MESAHDADNADALTLGAKADVLIVANLKEERFEAIGLQFTAQLTMPLMRTLFKSCHDAPPFRP